MFSVRLSILKAGDLAKLTSARWTGLKCSRSISTTLGPQPRPCIRPPNFPLLRLQPKSTSKKPPPPPAAQSPAKHQADAPVTATPEPKTSGISPSKSSTAPKFRYPPTLNIYDSGKTTNLITGALRLTTIVVFLVGTFIYLPAVCVDPGSPWWLIPAAPVVSAIPMVTVILCWAPMVWHIHIPLPPAARRSKEGLMKFAANVPGDTRLQFRGMRLLPWPSTKTVPVRELRRLKPSKVRLANLEWRISRDKKVREGWEEGFWWRLVRRTLGSFYVNRAQVVDRSLVPGVWEEIWWQIPMSGEEWGSKRAQRAKASAKKGMSKS